MVDYPIVLTGPGFEGDFFRPEALGIIQRTLPDSLRNAVRMRLYASSRKVGRVTNTVASILDFWVGDTHADKTSGGTAMIARLPRLGDVAPDIFRQGVLFEDILKPDDTAFDLLGDVIHDVAAGDRGSDKFDAGFLRTFRNYARAISKGMEQMKISGLRRTDPVAIVNSAVTTSAEKLIAETPAPQRARISARLDSLTFSLHCFGLLLPDGAKLRGLWIPDDFEELKQFGGHSVVVEGTVQFKPNGKPIGIEAEAIRIARPGDEFWAQLPGQSRLGFQTRVPHLIFGEKNPLQRLSGVWDADVSDEEFSEMMAAFRK